ncbi:MAG TPA: glycosyltransferase [Syntrophomonadaceae bacterium]|nr:glycosyltransferase [Syntrophomonadaceae bacterium]
MNVLFLSPEIPYPPNRAGRMDIYYSLLEMKRNDWNIYLVFVDNGEENLANSLDFLKSICDKIIFIKHKKNPVSLLHPSLPYYAASNRPNRTERNQLANFISSLDKQIDVVIMDHPQVFEAAKYIIGQLKTRQDIGPRIIYRMHNIEADYYEYFARDLPVFSPRKYLNLAEMHKMKRYERSVANYADKILCLSKTETEYINDSKQYSTRAVWCPILFKPDTELSEEEMTEYVNLRNTYKDKTVLLFLSNFQNRFNVNAAEWFIQNVLPGLIENKPDIIFHIAGYDADKYLAKYDSGHIKIFSNVKSAKPFIKLADLVLILTNSKAGVKVKLIEALYYNKKIVSTYEGVVGSGLEEYIPSANSPELFAGYCLQAIDNQFDYGPARENFARLYRTDNFLKEVKP